MTLFNLAWQLSECINPIFIALLLEEPLRHQEGQQEKWPVFWLRSVVSISAAVYLAEEGKRHIVFAGHPTFPSGHMTFATAAAACLVLQRGPRWLLLTAPLAAAIGVSLVIAGWHRPVDIAGGLLLGMIVPVLAAKVRILRLNQG